MKVKKIDYLGASFALACLSASGQFAPVNSAFAEDLDDLPFLEEIVVTAQKRSQSVNDVPITISAFSGEQLQDLGVIDTRDLGKIVPNFNYSDTGLNTPVFTLRGIGFNDFSPTAAGTVGLYVGEFNLPYPVMGKGPNVDIERIEVLKGPQGTLYGRNTTAGVVNFIPATPGDHLEAGVTASYSRFETYDVEGFVSGPLSDNLGMRLAARKISSNEGWQNSLTRPGDTLGEQDKWSARYTLDWTPSDVLRATLVIDAWKDQGDPQAAQVIGLYALNPILGAAALDQSVVAHPLVPMNTHDMRVADWPPLSKGYKWENNDSFRMNKLRLDWDISEYSMLSYLVSYADFSTDKATFPSSGFSVLNAEGVIDVDTTAWTHELRLTGGVGEDFDYILGLYYSEDDVFNHWLGLVNTISNLFPNQAPPEQNNIADLIDSEVKQHAETQAIYTDVTWRFLPSVSFTAGARYTDETRDFEGCTLDNADAVGSSFAEVINTVSSLRGGSADAQRGECITLDHVTGDPGLVVEQLDEDNVSGRVVLDWTPVDDWLFYASFSRGYKTGSYPIAQASDSQQFRPVTQERLDAIELGGKMSLLSRRVQLNFAVFDYDYRDKQLLGFVLDPVFGPLLQLANAPKSEVQGAELDIRARATSNLDVYLSAGFVDTEIKKYSGINQDGDLEDYAGQELNYAPDLMGTLGLRYTWDIPWSDTFDVVFGADYSYNGETSAVLNDDPRYKIDDYYNVNAQIALASIDGIWEVKAWGRNITNEYQPVSVGATFNDAIQRYVKMPQTYGVTFKYNYGQ